MGKKNKTATGLGRSLIKDRFGSHKGRKLAGDSSMVTYILNFILTIFIIIIIALL